MKELLNFGRLAFLSVSLGLAACSTDDSAGGAKAPASTSNVASTTGASKASSATLAKKPAHGYRSSSDDDLQAIHLERQGVDRCAEGQYAQPQAGAVASEEASCGAAAEAHD